MPSLPIERESRIDANISRTRLQCSRKWIDAIVRCLYSKIVLWRGRTNTYIYAVCEAVATEAVATEAVVTEAVVTEAVATKAVVAKAVVAKAVVAKAVVAKAVVAKAVATEWCNKYSNITIQKDVVL